MNKHRISTNIGKDQFVNVELKQEFDLLEILSLKFTQKDIYTSYCADYGVVVGRVTVNNGLGVPNARVSIFIPLSEEDEDDPVISTLYPYKSVTDKTDDGYRYNLLPARQQHGGHEPTGTFPDQSDVLNREEILEVYEKYYKYTVRTNESGDFMIWGVPVGPQTLHLDIDLSDIGEYSLRPYDFIRKGAGVDDFKSSYQFKSSTDISELPQIISTDKTVEVYPFWGSKDLCEIGISRNDFDLSDQGIHIEPKSYVLGSIFSDSGKNSVNKNCQVQAEMGRKCNLITSPGKIEAIRFTTSRDSNNRPILEEYKIIEDIEEDGSFVLPLPMNMDYKYTNEFGEIEYTNDPDKGVPTSACYRMRVSINNSEAGRTRTTAAYLVPNIREYSGNVEKSYAWSLDWADYPTEALNNDILFNNEHGKYYPQDYFYRFTSNKVYSVSSFISSYFTKGTFGRDTFIGIKQIAPKEEDECDNNVQSPPINWGLINYNFSVLLAIVINTLEKILLKAFVLVLQTLIWPFQQLYSIGRKIPIVRKLVKPLDKVIEWIQDFGTLTLGIVPYPFCEKCEENELTQSTPIIDGDEDIPASSLYQPVLSGTGKIVESVFDGVLKESHTFKEIILSLPESSGQPIVPNIGSKTLEQINEELSNYIFSVNINGVYVDSTMNLTKNPHIFLTETEFYFKFTDLNQDIPTSSNSESYSYIIYDNTQPIVEGSPDKTTSADDFSTECGKYVSVYDERAKLLGGDIVDNGNKIGEVLLKTPKNHCEKCVTESGYSEFKRGVFTIIPAASTKNWEINKYAINEYAERKLIGKLFCGGIVNYSFIDNWLHGSLYFFLFKAKVRWNKEDDLDYRRTRYCDDLVYYNVPHKKFYYKSTKTTDGINFLQHNNNNLGYPTTFMDLGVRDEFINEITINKDIDPNSSVIRNIGSTSFQNFKEMMELYIDLTMDRKAPDISYKDFFKNTSYIPFLPRKFDDRVLNGDVTQLISINNEVGIEEFDLQNINYGAYQPDVIDYEDDLDLLSGPYPINLVLDDGEGFRVRDSINNSSDNTINSSQTIPFYLWDKKGYGFGNGVNQGWHYTSITPMKAQHMTYDYLFDSGEYILYPMTKTSDGKMFTNEGSVVNDVAADIEDVFDLHTEYNSYDEGFTFLYITSGDKEHPVEGILYTRVGNKTLWEARDWNENYDYIIKPTSLNYGSNNNYKQILSTPFLYYFGLKSGKSAVDKFTDLFGPKGVFPSAE